MHKHNAVLIFFKTPEISRHHANEPFAALTWEDLDTLFTAMAGDVVKNLSQMNDVDILVCRNPKEISDDYFLPFMKKLHLFDLNDTPLTIQAQKVVESAFLCGYQRIVVLLDHTPLITRKLLRKIFVQLKYEDDCVVVSPTFEGRCSLIGMKSNHSQIFNLENGDPLVEPDLLMKYICDLTAVLFVLDTGYSLVSASNLIRLRNDIESLDSGSLEFPAKTFDMFRMLERKYKLKI